MEISKEMKEKLLKAGGEDEVSALPGEATTGDQAARMWQEIQAHRQTLEEVDDGELEAVSGDNIFTRPFDPPDRDYERTAAPLRWNMAVGAAPTTPAPSMT